MRKLIVLILTAALLCGWAAAEQAQTVEQIVADFMAENGLSEQNFSLSYYNTVTGEAYAFNDTKFAIAASTYKLPLNMYFYEMQRDGQITGDTIIEGTGKTLDTCHQMSIVDSNNEVSETMMYYWGGHTQYKENMRKYFTMTDKEIDPLYYQGNFYCVRMMMDALRYLYANSGDFEELIGYMKIAAPDSYFKLGVQDYEVAHKYGEVQWFMNDTAIIYTPQPFLLAVYTQSVCSQQVLADIARLLTDYTVEQGKRMEAETAEESEEIELELTFEPVSVEPEEPEPMIEEAAAEEPVIPKTAEEDAVETVPMEERPSPGWIWAAPAVIAAAAVIGIWKKKKS